MFNLNINTNGAAYTEIPDSVEYEVVSNLRDVIEKLENGYTSGKIMDTNGNTVGNWELS